MNTTFLTVFKPLNLTTPSLQLTTLTLVSTEAQKKSLANGMCSLDQSAMLDGLLLNRT